MKRNKEMRESESDKCGWNKIERKMKECVRSVIREEMRIERSVNKMRGMSERQNMKVVRRRMGAEKGVENG